MKDKIYLTLIASGLMLGSLEIARVFNLLPRLPDVSSVFVALGLSTMGLFSACLGTRRA